MDHFAGLDVSVKETSVCIVDDTGKIVREVKVASEPEASVGGAKEPRLPLQANWIGGWTAVAMAVQRSRGSRVTGRLRPHLTSDQNRIIMRSSVLKL